MERARRERKPPETLMRGVGFSVPQDMLARVREIQNEYGLPGSWIAREALAAWLERYDRTGQLRDKGQAA